MIALSTILGAKLLSKTTNTNSVPVVTEVSSAKYDVSTHVNTVVIPTPVVTNELVKIINGVQVKTKNVTNLKVDTLRLVEINSPIGSNILDVVNKLRKLEAANNKPIFMTIDSPGGSVIDGRGLIAQMQSMKSPIYTVCTKMCASMAAIIHQYGTERYALDGSILMFHPASGGAQGQLDNMLSLLGTIKSYLNKMNAYIISRSKMSKEDFDKAMAYELWLDAEDAQEKGFVDKIVSINVDLSGPAPELPSDRVKTRPDRSQTKTEFNIEL